MKIIAITQRVEEALEYEETRDCLDQAWTAFLMKCGYIPLLIPNSLTQTTLISLMKSSNVAGIVLSGGNNMPGLTGHNLGRDQTESNLLTYSIDNSIPLIGVCRGMQFIGGHWGASVVPIQNHVAENHLIYSTNHKRLVNSYHDYALIDIPDCFNAEYIAEDGSVEAFSHTELSIYGMMWHPERNQPFHADDVQFFNKIFR